MSEKNEKTDEAAFVTQQHEEPPSDRQLTPASEEGQEELPKPDGEADANDDQPGEQVAEDAAIPTEEIAGEEEEPADRPEELPAAPEEKDDQAEEAEA